MRNPQKHLGLDSFRLVPDLSRLLRKAQSDTEINTTAELIPTPLSSVCH